MEAVLIVLFAPALIGLVVALGWSFVADAMHGWFSRPIIRVEPWRGDPRDPDDGEPVAVLEWEQAA